MHSSRQGWDEVAPTLAPRDMTAWPAGCRAVAHIHEEVFSPATVHAALPSAVVVGRPCWPALILEWAHIKFRFGFAIVAVPRLQGTVTVSVALRVLPRSVVSRVDCRIANVCGGMPVIYRPAATDLHVVHAANGIGGRTRMAAARSIWFGRRSSASSMLISANAGTLCARAV